MEEHTRTLVSLAQDADRDAIDRLFARYRDPLKKALSKMLGPRYRLLVADSEDAAQDAVLRALGRIGEFEYRGEGSFLGWLLKMAHFEILQKIRYHERRRRMPAEGGAPGQLDGAPEPVADQTAVPERISVDELQETIRTCMDELPEREREVIVMRRFMELDVERICEELDLPSASAARSLLSRAQARLVGVMARHGIKDIAPG